MIDIDDIFDFGLKAGAALVTLAGLLFLAVICAGLWKMFVWMLA